MENGGSILLFLILGANGCLVIDFVVNGVSPFFDFVVNGEERKIMFVFEFFC